MLYQNNVNICYCSKTCFDFFLTFVCLRHQQTSTAANSQGASGAAAGFARSNAANALRSTTAVVSAKGIDLQTAAGSKDPFSYFSNHWLRLRVSFFSFKPIFDSNRASGLFFIKLCSRKQKNKTPSKTVEKRKTCHTKPYPSMVPCLCKTHF